MMLTRDAILSKSDRQRIEVEVPEWGGSVYLTELSVRDRAAIMKSWAKVASAADDARVDAMIDAQLLMVAMSVTDESGVRIFELVDIEALAEKSREAVGKIADAATVLNKFTVSATEDEAKN